MSRIRFIHCADIHFDTSFSGLPSNKANIRRDELRSTFSGIINLCIEKNVDILLIAGDIFDNTRVTDETIGFLIDSFLKIPEVRVFITPGNHDPYMPGSMYEDSKWPENVHVFSEKSITRVHIPELDLNVYGAAFTTPYIDRNMLESFSADILNSEDTNILVMHGDITDNSQSNAYNPISESSIAQSGFDYIALGHKHTLHEPEILGKTYYAYPGAPEGRGFDETGEMGVIYGELSGIFAGNPLLYWEFIPCSKRIYQDITVDLTGCNGHEEISQRITPFLSDSMNLYRVSLTGALKSGIILDLNILYSRFSENYFYIRFRDLTSTELDLETLSKETMLKGIFARRMLAKIEEAKRKGNEKEEKLLSDALAMGLKAFEGEVPVYDNQIS